MINWSAKDSERIAQNTRNLLSLTQFEILHDLGRGINPSIIDQGIHAADLALSEAYRVVMAYEPSASLESISYVDGQINVEVSDA